MRKIVVTLGVLLVCLFVSHPVLAINKAPVKELIVAADGEFTTIQAAINYGFNNGASAANPYIVKVMPGIYNESIQMKPYVDVVGSGRNNTKITSSSYATVIGADNSSIENLWIDSTGASSSQSYNPSAILNDGTSMAINNVKATMNDPVVPEYGGGAIHASVIQTLGTGAKPVISNCTIYGTGTNQRSIIGIGTFDYGSSTITNCDITIDTSEDTPGPSYISWNVGIFLNNSSTASVKNSVIKVTGADYNEGISSTTSYSLYLNGSKIEVVGTPNTISNQATRNSTVTNSELVVSGTGTNCVVDNTNSRVGGSLIDGPVCGGKIVNSWDGYFNPIPNQ